jgi:hypothetical protein
MEFDTDVSHYTDQEIKELLDLEELNYDDIVTATQLLIDEHQDNPDLVSFYTDIMDRYEKKDTTTKTIDAEVKKGTINPDLKNTITRMINIDSSYRELSNDIYNTDNYIFTLNEPINNVISLMLFSVEIPQSWYTFSLFKGNTSFQPILMVQNGVNIVKYEYPAVIIRNGNYTTKSLLQMVTTTLFKECGIFKNQVTANPLLTESDVLTIDQDAYTGRCVVRIHPGFEVTNILLPDGTLFNLPYTECKIGFLFHSVELKTKINYNLGWLLGFRIPFALMLEPFLPTKRIIPIEIVSESIIDTAGTKYIILKLDDYKSNRLNKSLVCINTKVEQTIPLPSYYNKSLSQYQTSATTLNVLPNAPRQLTSKQMYTINSISNARMVDASLQRITSPDDSDIFAKIPIKKATEWGVFANDTYSSLDNGPGKLIIEFSGPLQLNTRDYFGPVNMTSFAVSLYDDKGMILGLNGMDWSFTIIAKSIYQY